jgi:DMSO reductase anchor subunit
VGITNRVLNTECTTWQTSTTLTVFLVLIGLMGCRAGAPIYDIKSTAIPNSIDGSLPLAQITKSITTAAAKHGWEMRVDKPGYIVGTLQLREHEAVVADIIYNTKSYSILYKSSQNLQYDEKNRTIHKNYNSWIRNLTFQSKGS